MKNLKKVLALVLVVAMIMGLAITSNAAFKDADSIKNTQAVDVMAGIGVINGFTDGTFKPTDNVTRAQMAKMVTYILNKGTDVGSLYAAANTFTDCTSHWAKGYIAYAAKTGIVAGMGDGKFNPDGSVTGVQAAKMLLCALGYDATIEQYTGANWVVNVLNDADAAGLLKNLSSVDMSKALTRDEAAQMMFNALKATMVKYTNKGTTITINGATIATGASDASEYPNTDTKTIKDDNYMQLAEKYFPDLKLTNPSDDFGRPASKWTYKTTTIGTYPDAADLTYTAAVKNGTIYTDLGLSSSVATANITVYRNGVDAKPSAYVIAKGDTVKLGGNGVLVEVYNDTPADGKVTIVMIDTYVGTIASVKAATSTKDAYVTITDASATAPASNLTYDTTAFAEDDVVLYTYANSAVQSLAKAKSVAGTLTAFTTGSALTLDSTEYKYSAMAVKNTADAVKSSITAYLDNYGYCIYNEVTAAATVNYAYVLDTGSQGIYLSDNTYYAKLLFADGTVKSVVTAKDYTADGTAMKGKIVTYTADSASKYTLTAKSTAATTGTTSLTKGTAAITLNGASTYANSATLFLVASGDSSDPTYTAYTGISNVPSISGTTKAASYVKSGTMMTVAYIDATSATITTSTSDVIYVVGSSISGLKTNSDSQEYYTYDAVVNGKVTTVNVLSDTSISGLKGYTSGTTTTNGIYKSFTADSYMKTANGTKKVSSGAIGFGGTYYTMSKDFALFYVDSDGTLATYSANSVADDNNDAVVFYYKDGEVTSAVIQYVADPS